MTQLIPYETVSPVACYLARLGVGSRTTQASAIRLIFDLCAKYGHSGGWHDLTPEAVTVIRATVCKRYKPKTAQRVMAALKGVLQECWRLGLLPQDKLARLTDWPAVKGSAVNQGRALTPAEVEALWYACERPLERSLYALSIAGALRRAEVAGITQNYVTTLGANHSIICITVHGKGSKVRRVYLAGRWAGAVRDWPNINRTPHSVWYLLRQLGRRAGVSFTPHDLRRTALSRALELGVDLGTVQKMAGHADPRTTSVYDRRAENTLVEAACKLASV